MKLAVDAVVFSVNDARLRILLIKRKNQPFIGRYALPGGFVEQDEGLDIAVIRELTEETGVKDIFLKQLKTYGDVGRDPRGRVISVAYLALISWEHKLKASSDALRAEWFDIGKIPSLAFDHKTIIDDALVQLRLEIQTTNISCQILPQKFTLTQMQHLYESILERKLDKRNFRKKLRELDILKETREAFMDGAHRPAMLYEFRNKAYSDIKDKVHVMLK
ncbi:MAG: NUDIX hydrolase [Candidatus Woesearchaeota archaeon]|nr:NUDIX hydrolase [Candidatus Woesearchaeota archaeon]